MSDLCTMMVKVILCNYCQ